MKHAVQLHHFAFAVGLLVLALPRASPIHAQTPEWIWHDNKGAAPADGEVRFFRKSFTIEGTVARAVIAVAGDDQAQAFLNGKQVANSRGWDQPSFGGVAPSLTNGENLLAIRGRNNSSAAAVLLRLDLTFQDGGKQTIVTDASWVSFPTPETDWNRPQFDASGWTKVVSLGKLGVPPWGDVLKPREATPVEALKVADGFKIELLRSAAPGEGSWVAMTVDHKGRLIISPQGSEPMLRVSLEPKGGIARLETIDLPISGAMGLLYAFDSLYVNGQGS
ncbi:MAG: hypothetical protein L0Z50_10360, partial [Verrucomicrobiales bacterium]|nr:hypothetical protein [Verrucomicrobiales bacterium]